MPNKGFQIDQCSQNRAVSGESEGSKLELEPGEEDKAPSCTASLLPVAV